MCGIVSAYITLRMYDVDGNGSIEFTEMRRVVGAVYEMLGTEAGTTGKAQVSRLHSE